MPNVALITNEDQPLNLPAHSIRAVIGVGSQEIANAPGSQTVIYAEFRGGMTYFLGQPSGEVLEAVRAGDVNPDRWAVFSAETAEEEGEEIHAIDRSILQGYQSHGKGGMKDAGAWIEAYIARPSNNPDARDATLALKATVENLASLDQILLPGRDATAAETTVPVKKRSARNGRR